MTRLKPLPPTLVLACGCEIMFRDGETPLCSQHGLQRVVRTVRMPPPRFTGLATGPHVIAKDLGAFSGKFIQES